MRNIVAAATMLGGVLIGTTLAHGENWSLGGNMGLSLLGGSPGFHMTPMVELHFNRNIGIGSELGLNTQYGAPLIWFPYFKYTFPLSGATWKPYGSVGPVLVMNVPNGPCFGLLFGGGAAFPIGRRLYLVPNLTVGPIFGFGGGALPLILTGNYWGIQTYGLTTTRIPGTTILSFSLRAGIRYEI